LAAPHGFPNGVRGPGYDLGLNAPAPSRWQWRSPLVGAALFLLALGLYLPFRSPALDDWDSVQFAMGVERYDLAQYRPHFPGYPVYIGLLRIWRSALTATATDVSTDTVLTTWSALAGAATVFVLYWLGTWAFDERAGALGAAFAMLHPLFWLEAEKALTGTTGTLCFALLLACVLAFLRHRQAPWLVLAAVVSGLSLGVRPVDAVLASSALVYALYHARGRHLLLMLCTAAFAAAVAAWLIPQIISVGGWTRYEALFERTAQQSASVDSIFADRSWGERSALLRDYLFGEWAWIICCLGAVGFVALLSPTAGKASREAAWLLVVAALLLFAFYGVMGAPRAQWYFLPTVVGLSMLAGYGLTTILRVVVGFMPSGAVRRIAPPLVILAALIPLISGGESLAGTLSRSPSPGAQAARYAAAEFGDRPLIVLSNYYRHFEYYLPDNARVLSPAIHRARTGGRERLDDVMSWAGTDWRSDDRPVILVTGDVRGGVEFPTELLATFTRDPRLHRNEGPVSLYRAMDGATALGSGSRLATGHDGP
jgi:hypothetical protein